MTFPQQCTVFAIHTTDHFPGPLHIPALLGTLNTECTSAVRAQLLTLVVVTLPTEVDIGDCDHVTHNLWW